MGDNTKAKKDTANRFGGDDENTILELDVPVAGLLWVESKCNLYREMSEMSRKKGRYKRRKCCYLSG